MKLVAREGQIELEPVDGNVEEQREMAELLAESGELFLNVVADNGRLHVQSQPAEADLTAYRAEGAGWLKAIAAGGAFDFWDNAVDDETWNNA